MHPAAAWRTGDGVCCEWFEVQCLRDPVPAADRLGHAHVHVQSLTPALTHAKAYPDGANGSRAAVELCGPVTSGPSCESPPLHHSLEALRLPGDRKGGRATGPMQCHFRCDRGADFGRNTKKCQILAVQTRTRVTCSLAPNGAPTWAHEHAHLHMSLLAENLPLSESPHVAPCCCAWVGPPP